MKFQDAAPLVRRTDSMHARVIAGLPYAGLTIVTERKPTAEEMSFYADSGGSTSEAAEVGDCTAPTALSTGMPRIPAGCRSSAFQSW